MLKEYKNLYLKDFFIHFTDLPARGSWFAAHGFIVYEQNKKCTTG